MKILKKSFKKTPETNESKIPTTINKITKPTNPQADETARKRMAALSRAREEKKVRKEAGEVDKRRNPLEVWQDDPKSMRKAINANCYDCVGTENFRNRIRFCDMFKCSFWLLRPYSKSITKEQCKEWVEVQKPEKEESED